MNEQNQLKFFYYQRSSDASKYNRFVLPYPADGELSRLDFQQQLPTMSYEAAAYFMSQLPLKAETDGEEHYNGYFSRSVYINNEKIYQYYIIGNNVAIRYCKYNGGAQWKFKIRIKSNKLYFKIFDFEPGDTNKQITDKIKAGFHAYHLDHPYRCLSKRLSKHDDVNPIFKQGVSNLFTQKSTEQCLTKDFFKKHKGYYRISILDEVKENYPMIYKDENSAIHSIQSIVYLSPAFKDIIEISNNIELDCSFYALRPYVYTKPLFGSLSAEFIGVGAETGRLPEMLMRAAEILQYRFDDTLKNLKTVLEPLLLTVAAGVVSAVILAVAAPMFSLSGALPGF